MNTLRTGQAEVGGSNESLQTESSCESSEGEETDDNCKSEVPDSEDDSNDVVPQTRNMQTSGQLPHAQDEQ